MVPASAPCCDELETIFDMAFDQITIADGNGVFLKVSKACAQNFGIPLDQIIGASAFDLEKQGIFDVSTTVTVLRTQQSVTLVQKTKGGRKLLVSGKPLFDSQGRLVRVINISRDITLEESLKEELHDAELLIQALRRQPPPSPGDEQALVGRSPAMQAAMETAMCVASLDTTVLLLGETGVGKGVFARKIHDSGRRRNEPFININCGAIPPALLESELFGYLPGAYTGAQSRGKEGLLVAAKKGTIFLDEISELPLELQVKLLHVLQDHTVTRLGGVEPTRIQARFIAAANKDLKKLVEEGKFRQDLYYRLNIVPIVIPPLRQRLGDIQLFTQYFARQINLRYGMHKEFSPQAIQLLESHDWPGNVRELENMVERLIVTTQSPVIGPEAVSRALGNSFSSSADAPLPPLAPQSLPQAVEELEERMLREALQSYHTTRRIGEALGIDQSTVSKKLKKYGLTPHR